MVETEPVGVFGVGGWDTDVLCIFCLLTDS